MTNPVVGGSTAVVGVKRNFTLSNGRTKNDFNRFSPSSAVKRDILSACTPASSSTSNGIIGSSSVGSSSVGSYGGGLAEGNRCIVGGTSISGQSSANKPLLQRTKNFRQDPHMLEEVKKFLRNFLQATTEELPPTVPSAVPTTRIEVNLPKKIDREASLMRSKMKISVEARRSRRNKALKKHMEGKRVNRDVCKARIEEMKQETEAGSTSEAHRLDLKLYKDCPEATVCRCSPEAHEICMPEAIG